MGLLSLIPPGNPLSVLSTLSRPLNDVGYGLMKGKTFREGLAEGAEYSQKMAPYRMQEMQRQDELNQVSEQKNRTVQAMLEAGREDLANMAEAGQMAMAWKLFAEAKQAEMGGGPDAPSSVREWEYFNALSPDEQAAYLRMKRSNPYLDLGDSFAQPNPVAPGTTSGPAIPKNGGVPTGYEQAPGGGIRPMAGSEQDIDRRNAELKARRSVEIADKQTANVLDAIDTATQQAGWGETGLIGAIAGNVPGSQAYDLRKTVTTIKANLGFAELQAMRDASPTGGALGQVAIQELEALQSTVASLDPNQSQEALKAGLEKIRQHLLNMQAIRQQALAEQYGGGAPSAGAVGGTIDDILSTYGL